MNKLPPPWKSSRSSASRGTAEVRGSVLSLHPHAAAARTQHLLGLGRWRAGAGGPIVPVMKTNGRHLVAAAVGSIVLAGCGSGEDPLVGSNDEATKEPAKPKCISLEPNVVKNFDDGATGPGIKTKLGEAVKLSEPIGTKPRVNYAVALAVDTPDGAEVAILATERLDGGGFTVAVDDTARKLYVYAADWKEDSIVGEIRSAVEPHVAAVAARECLN